MIKPLRRTWKASCRKAPAPPPRLRRAVGLAWVLLLPILAVQATGTVEEQALIRRADGTEVSFTIEIADTPEERSRGLMHRRQVPARSGMLFIFPEERQATMWMQNTYVSLDMLFLKSDGRIAGIAARTRPLSTELIHSQEDVRAVLEINGGEAEALGIRPGDRLISPPLD